jgi:hypothetical protein
LGDVEYSCGTLLVISEQGPPGGASDCKVAPTRAVKFGGRAEERMNADGRLTGQLTHLLNARLSQYFMNSLFYGPTFHSQQHAALERYVPPTI